MSLYSSLLYHITFLAVYAIRQQYQKMKRTLNGRVRVRFLQRGKENGRIGPKEGKDERRRETRDESGV